MCGLNSLTPQRSRVKCSTDRASQPPAQDIHFLKHKSKGLLSLSSQRKDGLYEDKMITMENLPLSPEFHFPLGFSQGLWQSLMLFNAVNAEFTGLLPGPVGLGTVIPASELWTEHGVCNFRAEHLVAGVRPSSIPSAIATSNAPDGGHSISLHHHAQWKPLVSCHRNMTWIKIQSYF